MSDLTYWSCPFCNTHATITASNRSSSHLKFDDGAKDGPYSLLVNVITCPNKACREYEIKAFIRKMHSDTTFGAVFEKWQLRPQSHAKPFPDFIPKPILDDYSEACAIRDLSPKASATLSRRCLQGIIRDFWGISKPRLVDEIEALKSQIDHSTWQAIDAVRSIGNIGAHMERDINLVVDVEPKEAQLLTELIEILLNDWYVARRTREMHFSNIVTLAKSKEEQKDQRQPAVPAKE